MNSKIHPGHNRVRFSQLVLAIGASVLLSDSSMLGAEFLGAAAFLQKTEEKTPGSQTRTNRSEAEVIRDDLKTFRAKVATLPPVDAAKQWLELVDRGTAHLAQRSRSGGRGPEPLQPADFLRALPPPAVWGELNRAIGSRPPVKAGEVGDLRNTGLQLLGAALVGNAEARTKAVESIRAAAKSYNPNESSDPSSYLAQSVLDRINQSELLMSEDPDSVMKSLSYQLSSSLRGFGTFEIPNLVTLIGREKAETFLRKALVVPKLQLEVRKSTPTSELAQKLALELIDQLKTPQWALVNSPDAVPLYEAMLKRFPPATNQLQNLLGTVGAVVESASDEFSDPTGFSKQQADAYYLLGLIAANRTADAVAIASQFKKRYGGDHLNEILRASGNQRFSQSVDSFLYELLSKDPSLPYWPDYVKVSADAGKTDRMMALIQTTIQKPGLKETLRSELDEILMKALLAADDVEGGVKKLRLLAGAEDKKPNSMNEFSDSILGLDLVEIGRVSHRPEWIEEGIRITREWLGRNTEGGSRGRLGESIVIRLSFLLTELNRGPEAEAVLLEALTKPQVDEESELRGSSAVHPALEALAAVYSAAGRHEDVLLLLQKSRGWAVEDLAEAVRQNRNSWGPSFHSHPTHPSISHTAAKALAATGRTEESLRIVDALLDASPGDDRAFELLLQLRGTNSMQRLDALFARDPFEERPLIWKAHLQREQGLLAEAESTVRKAIAIDPSDGEQGRGDRMRAYSELALILEARGDRKGAETYREVVKAIRMSEDADQVHEAGLLKRAIGMYQEAIGHFADAYCIQSRLAVQLAALGRNREAEEHYRRAFELMPDSFGRVESHCFGCEGAFQSSTAQGIAEKVFTQLVAARPEKPQLHYLLGYLRQQQDRLPEARTNFVNAVRLDPDYLNAWVKLHELGAQSLMPTGIRDESTLNLIRLDPQHRHSSANFQDVVYLAGLWKSLEEASKHRVRLPSKLYSLEASKAQIEKQRSNPRFAGLYSHRYSRNSTEDEQDSYTPAEGVSKTAFVEAAQQLIFGANNF